MSIAPPPHFICDRHQLREKQEIFYHIYLSRLFIRASLAAVLRTYNIRSVDMTQSLEFILCIDSLVASVRLL